MLASARGQTELLKAVMLAAALSDAARLDRTAAAKSEWIRRLAKRKHFFPG
jgi:hypothetical protein